MESIDDMPIKPMKTEFILKNGTTVVFIGSVEDIIPLINSMGLRDELINDPDCGSSDVENTEGSQGVQSTEGSGSKSSPKGVRRASSTWETYQYADLDCQLGEPIERWKIMKGISDVQAIKGNMRIEGFCSAVSCNDGAAIHACPNVSLVSLHFMSFSCLLPRYLCRPPTPSSTHLWNIFTNSLSTAQVGQ